MGATIPGDATVLLVDDEPDLVDVFRVYLDRHCETRVATSGAEALEQVDGEVDLALLDRRMPQMTGDEVLEEIRARDYNFPVIMVSAVEPDAGADDLSFDGYLTKPIDQEELLATVREHIRTAG